MSFSSSNSALDCQVYFFFSQKFMVGQKEYDYESSKKILLFNALHGIHERWALKPGNDEFQNRKCQVDNCYITENKYQLGNNK